MVIDSSALTAILANEPERPAFVDLIELAKSRLLAAPIYLETCMVVEGRNGDRGARELDLFLSKSNIEIVPFTRDHAEYARVAFRLYGKGNHRAGLNFGDCISYALAKAMDEPLLFKGTDFGLTDIRSVV